MTRKSSISPEDAALFRDTVGRMAPVPRSGRRTPDKPPPDPQARQSEQDERDVIEGLLDHPIDPAMLETGEELEYRQNGVQLAVLRKLRRGQYACQAALDLHGCTAAQARIELQGFLQRAQARGLGCVRIIHGKGLRSSRSGPVLKPRVAAWLRQRNDVLAYCSARPVDGGGGAVYVLLKRG